MSEDDYYFIQYTADECEKDFNGRAPIWGRQEIEGRILCQQLNLEGICFIEILEDPETKQPVVGFQLVTRDTYRSIAEEEAQFIVNNPNIPILVVEQRGLHFVPLLEEPTVVQTQEFIETRVESARQFGRP